MPALRMLRIQWLSFVESGKKTLHYPSVAWNKQESTIIHIKYIHIIWTENGITGENTSWDGNFLRAVISRAQGVLCRVSLLQWSQTPAKGALGKGFLEVKAENGRRADLQQTSILFHGDAIKQSCQGSVSLGAFQEQSASSCRILLLPSDQYSSNASPISVQALPQQEQGDGFIPGRFQSIFKVVVVTWWIIMMGFVLCQWVSAQDRRTGVIMGFFSLDYGKFQPHQLPWKDWAWWLGPAEDQRVWRNHIHRKKRGNRAWRSHHQSRKVYLYLDVKQGGRTLFWIKTSRYYCTIHYTLLFLILQNIKPGRNHPNYQQKNVTCSRADAKAL